MGLETYPRMKEWMPRARYSLWSCTEDPTYIICGEYVSEYLKPPLHYLGRWTRRSWDWYTFSGCNNASSGLGVVFYTCLRLSRGTDRRRE